MNQDRNARGSKLQWLGQRIRALPDMPKSILLACVIGVMGGYGAILFTHLIATVHRFGMLPALRLAQERPIGLVIMCLLPAAGLISVAWFTRRFAPEAEGHGVPEVITAVARRDGVIRPRVALVKILASGFCIGTGGSVGREGPIVQIGSSLGSMTGQLFHLPPRQVKVLVAAGAAAGISATFHAPLAGVIFASEIILGSFAVETLTPIVVSSVLADVVQQRHGEHGIEAAFPDLNFVFLGAWPQLPLYVLLGLVCGLAAVGFTKLLYQVEDLARSRLPNWWVRALVLGTFVGLAGLAMRGPPPISSDHAVRRLNEGEPFQPPLFGVGYYTIEHALHLQSSLDGIQSPAGDRNVWVPKESLGAELLWLLPLALLKPLLTSLTLAGGGSGGIFAPSLYIGATVGGSFGLAANLLVPEFSVNPGVYAIVGMGAVVAGTTHGVLSAILIVYEMTDDYQIILPIMATAGLASIVASVIEPESIYYKKLSRRGETIARGHDMHRMEHVMVRDVMIRQFPTIHFTDNLDDIIRVARANSHLECLPVMNDDDELVGIIRPEDLHRALDTDLDPRLINADDIALVSPVAVAPDANLLEALRDFGSRDIEMLPVEVQRGDGQRKLVGLLLRNEVMRRYRMELLR